MNQQNTWNTIAPLWNLHRTKTPQEILQFYDSLPKKIKKNILDIGCGSGRNFQKLSNTKLYATDFSNEMLKLARKKAKLLKIDAEFKQTISENLLFDDNFFDAIICYAVLHCVDSKKSREKTLQEIYRTLKSKGKVILSVWTKNSSRLKNKDKETTIPWTINNKKIKRYTYIYDKKELEDLVKGIGFKIVECKEDKNITMILTKN
ncbi:class I SAM-dependent methyltransferase [archaeon]|jgi:ubiquinone/menaquinone biosynthesis C-methylase UbiE|nr:class I SAM-dependent methyltransferase [archaeon]MBT6606495.1 class I SAM-dependent methyltransferase [archaeon]MBT7251340.1 class I SAM-dependent methyltransferase [archaeon]MBT7661025.1 class I SAM-dependent methyltransferase [archaeon]